MTGRLRLQRAMAGIPPDQWSELAVSDDPFLSQAFLGAAEASGAAGPDLGWQPCHATLCDSAGELLGFAPLYRRTHSFGDFSRDWNWAPAFERVGVAYYPKLVTGIPYTPSGGPRFLVRQGVEPLPVVRELVGAVLDHAREAGLSSWQCLFIDQDPVVRDVLAENGFLFRRGCQFHWENRGYRDFEEFLAACSSDKRKKLRRERRRVAEAGLTLEVRHGDEIDEALWQSIYPHYQSTFLRFGNHPAFPPEFFVQAGTALKRRLVVFLARQDQRVVAAAICYRSGTTLFGRHWGAGADFHSLHFELCFYQGIEYCIRHGLARFEPGAQGEHKVSRGFSPVPTWSAFWIADPGMRRAVATFLEREAAAVVAYEAEMKCHEPFRRPAGDAAETIPRIS